MISCPIDIKDHQVVLQWLRYCKDYPADKRLKHPDKGAGSKLGLQKYETYYRKLDLYYQFSTVLTRSSTRTGSNRNAAALKARSCSICPRAKKATSPAASAADGCCRLDILLRFVSRVFITVPLSISP